MTTVHSGGPVSYQLERLGRIESVAPRYRGIGLLTERAQAMGPGVRLKLVLLSVAVLVVVSFGFTALSLSLTRGWIEEDLRERAIAFAREIAATIGDRRELESTALLHEQIRQILGIRPQRGPARHPRLRRRGRPHRRHEPCGPAAAVHPRGHRARPAGAGGLAADREPRGALLGSDGADHPRRHAGRGRRGALLARAGRPGGRAAPARGPSP